jgi:hypothetical protein
VIRLIEAYSFGRITIKGTTYSSDLIIYPDKIDDSWWRKSGHVLHKGDIDDFISYKPDVLIVGTGAQGLMIIPEETKTILEKSGIELIAHKTKKACEIYNLIVGKKTVVAAFHLTC